jgi:hypothetical protein
MYIFSDIVPPQNFSGSCNTQNIRHLFRLQTRQLASGCGQPVIAPALSGCFEVFASINLLDQLSLKDRLDGTIKRSWSKPKASAGLLLNLPHDCVSVQVATGEGKHNLEGSGG